MKLSDYARQVQNFFTNLKVEDNVSLNTIESYRTTFMLFSVWLRDIKHIPLSLMTLPQFTRALVKEFLEYLKEVRDNSNSTVQVRLAAIKSFADYLSYAAPDCGAELLEVTRLKFAKRGATQKSREIDHLDLAGLQLLVKTVMADTRNAERNFAIICVMCLQGLRVSEVADLRVRDVQLGSPSILRVYGKGGKVRSIPIPKNVQQLLKTYIKNNKLDHPACLDHPLFSSCRHAKLTRNGLYKMVRKYGELCHAADPKLVPDDLHPHMLRHSCAVLYLNAGIDLIYIRDILGHESVSTTQIYIGANNPERRREAVDKAVESILPDVPPESSLKNDKDLLEDQDLLKWLEGLGRGS